MQYTSLDHITRSVLNQKGYSIHWYFQYLKYAADCLRELHFDSLQNIQTKKIPVNSYNSFPLPCDYVDMVKLSVSASQIVRPLMENSHINRLNNLTSSGAITTYGSTDNYGELIAGDAYIREFGKYQSNSMRDGYKILREREEGQLSEDISADYVILEYISDGTGLTDAATRVHPYAQQCIEAYIFWKSSPNRDNPLSPEAEEFNRKHRVLRARLNPLTVTEIRRILEKNREDYELLPSTKAQGS